MYEKIESREMIAPGRETAGGAGGWQRGVRLKSLLLFNLEAKIEPRTELNGGIIWEFLLLGETQLNGSFRPPFLRAGCMVLVYGSLSPL